MGNGTNSTNGTSSACASGGLDMHATALTYFVSVRCSDAGPASYKLLTTAIPSHLVTGVSVHGELCPGAMVYHHWEHYNPGEQRSVRFRITKHGGDGATLVRHARARAARHVDPWVERELLDGHHCRVRCQQGT